MTRRGASLLAMVIGCLGLAACGGGGGSATPTTGGTGGTDTAGPPGGGGIPPLDIVQLPDGRVLAGSAAIASGDFVGRTFPLQFAMLLDDPPQSRSSADMGTVQVVDNDTLIISLPGGTPFPLTRVSPNQFSDGSVTVDVEDFGAARYLFLSAGDPGVEFLSTYGFETPVVSRPVSARYNATSAAGVFFTQDGSANGARVFARGTVDLVANFSGSGGTITGTLLDGSETIDFDDVGGANDRLFVTTTLDGTITEGGFTGTVGGSSSVSIAGGPPQDLNLVLSNSSATGKFFGTAADVASGIYGADAAFTPPGGTTQQGRLSGFFVATRD
jgi:hypothetical protein